MNVSLRLASLNMRARSALEILNIEGNRQFNLSFMELAMDKAGM